MFVVFPTGVGMNLDAEIVGIFRVRVPHGRGDEPTEASEVSTANAVFPTGVGMNRRLRQADVVLVGVPHGRGDEPTVSSSSSSIFACSPRAWG